MSKVFRNLSVLLFSIALIGAITVNLPQLIGKRTTYVETFKTGVKTVERVVIKIAARFNDE